jgi:hypothetical protein
MNGGVQLEYLTETICIKEFLALKKKVEKLSSKQQAANKRVK